MVALPKSSCAALWTVSVAAWLATRVPVMIPTPSATPRIVSALSSGRARSPRQARALRRIGSPASASDHAHLEAELCQAPDQIACLVIGSPAEVDLVEQRSVPDDKDAVRIGRCARVMRDQHDGLPQPVARIPEEVEDLRA